MTGPESAALLRSLMPVRTAAAGQRGGLAPSALEGEGFSELLKRAQRGEFGTGLPVKIAPNAGVELSDEQLTHLAVVADAAEASGATRALVMIDDLSLCMDVGSRTILGPADLTDGKVLTGIDGVIRLTAPPAGPLPIAGPRVDGGSMNTSILRALGRR